MAAGTGAVLVAVTTAATAPHVAEDSAGLPPAC